MRRAATCSGSIGTSDANVIALDAKTGTAKVDDMIKKVLAK